MRLLGPCLLVVCAVLPGLRAQQGKDPLSGGTCYDDIAGHLQTKCPQTASTMQKLSDNYHPDDANVQPHPCGHGCADGQLCDLNNQLGRLEGPGCVECPRGTCCAFLDPRELNDQLAATIPPFLPGNPREQAQNCIGGSVMVMQIPCPRDHVCRTGVTFPLGERPPRCTAAQMDLPEAQRNCMESCTEWWFEGMFGQEGWNKKVSTATVCHHAAG